MTLKTSEIESALLAKGFVEDSTHHKMFWLWLNGKKTSIRTKTSHGAREIDDLLIGKMSKQVKLSKPNFVKFVKCTLTGEEYARMMLGST